MIKISVIVPVYNTEKYLDKCLNSLVNQTLEGIEIIVVNDGSPDNSQNIIDKYVKEHSNVICYIKENGGLSDARNYGIKKAHGEYIGFVDSDDFIEVDMYDKLYKKAKMKDYDIVVGGLRYVYEDSNKILNINSGLSHDINNNEDVIKNMNNIYPTAWNKIYKKDLFNKDVLFKDKVWYEDVEMLYRLYIYVNSIGIVNEPLYNYLQRSGAITSTFNIKLYDIISNMDSIIDFYKRKDLYSKYYKELEYIYVRYMYAFFIKRATNFSYKDYLEAVDKAILKVKEYFPSYKKNKHFYISTKGIYLVMFNKKIAKLMFKIMRK